ncbi:MAG: rubrerythrin family protein [Eubacteriales bacterium]|nr:rubrerythrin family protein [Eubacteriales bacterium]
MPNLEGTKTQANLLAAFAGESQARTKYTFYASKAKKDGFEQIAALFDETAGNEKEHAELWFKFLHNGVSDTLSNLNDAAEGEHYEWSDMYAKFAADARAEGFEQIAAIMEGVAAVEREHELRFRTLAESVRTNKVFQKDASVAWVCRNCGHVHVGVTAPEVCPVCSHAQAYFQLKADNY